MNRPALTAAALLALVLQDAPAAAPSPGAPTASTATPAAPAASAARNAAARGTALPVGAETLPAEWLDAVEPGLSKAARGGPATPADKPLVRHQAVR